MYDLKPGAPVEVRGEFPADPDRGPRHLLVPTLCVGMPSPTLRVVSQAEAQTDGAKSLPVR